MHESLRLYPPLGLQARSPIVDDDVRGHRIPTGSLVFLSAYTCHRHPDFWDSPKEFDPGRFTEERSAGRPAHAWMPFTLGSRECLGIDFALMEVHLVIAAIAQRYRLMLVPGARIENEMLLALEPKYGLPMTAEQLSASPFRPLRESSRNRRGPQGHFALGVLLPFPARPLGTLRAAHEEFGDVVYFRGPLNGVFLANPRDIAYVMEDASRTIRTPSGSTRCSRSRRTGSWHVKGQTGAASAASRSPSSPRSM